MNIRKVIFTVSLIYLFCLVSYANAFQLPELKWTINKNVEKAFWVQDGSLVGILGNDFSVFDLKGKMVWKTGINNGSRITEKLKLITPDGLLVALSPKNGEKKWEKKFTGEKFNICEGIDGIYVIFSESSDSTQINVFSESRKPLWQKSLKSFYPVVVLPEGNFVVGMRWNSTNYGIEIQIVGGAKEPQTLVSLNDPAFMESPVPVVAINKLTKQTLIAVETAPWWTVISHTGEVLVNKNKLPLEKTDLVTSCGLGFALASSVGSKVISISEQGKVLWSQKYDRYINGISGNTTHIIVSIGNIGYPGKIFLYSKDGKQKGTIDIPISLNQVRLAGISQMVIGVMPVSKTYLFDFNRN